MAIQFKVGFVADTKDLEGSLQRVSTEIGKAFTTKGSITKELKDATQQAMILEKSLRRATSQDGTISYASLQFELNKANTSAAKMVTTLAAGGKDFTASLNAANAALALSNRSAITLGSKMKEIWRVTAQSFKFTAAQTFLRAVSSEAQQAVRWVTDLNAAVNEIAVVTGKTGNEITKVTEQAIKGSQQLKVAAKEYAQGALIFYQQGLNDEEVTRRNEITIKASLAANQSISEMSKQLTAIWNTYGMVGQEQERAASVGAALAAQTAVDFKDIATAMQAAAAPAAQMGVEYNQLAAIIATVGDVTQQSASTIGNAYKTIFSRFQQLKAEGTDGEVTLSSVSKQLESLGVHVLDQAGNLRELGVVINEVGQNWDNWSQTQQTAIAQIVGGTRQYGQFLALMQNFDKYQKNLSVAQGETGATLEGQYEQALDSIEHKAEMSAEAWKRAFGEAIPEDALKTFYDSLTMVADVFGGIIAGAGGLPGILTVIGIGLSGKIVPALITGAKNAQVIANSLTKAGRTRNIENDYRNQRQSLNNQDKALKDQGYTKMSEARLGIAAEQEKLKLNRQIALMNEQINNRMKTATAEEKVGLTIMQNRLKLALEENQAAIDRNTLLIQEGSQMTAITTALQQQTQEMIKQAELEEKIASQQLTQFQNRQYGKTGMTNAQAMEKFEADANNSKLTAGEQDAALQRYLALKQQELAIQNKIDEAAAKKTVYKDLKSQADSADKLANKLLQIEKNITKLNATGSRGGELTWSKQKAKLQELGKEMLNLGRTSDISEEKLNSLQQELDEIGSTTPKEGKEGLQQLLDLVQRISQATGATNDELTQFGADIVDNMEQRGKAEQAAGQVDENLKNPGPIKIDTAQMVSGFVQVGAAAAGAASAVVNLWDIVSNPDLTGVQKLIQSLGQLPIIIMSIKTISEQGSVAFDNLVKMGANMGQSMGGKLGTLAAGATGAEATLGATAAAAGIAATAILAVVAAIAAVVYAYTQWKNQQPEAMLEKARESAKHLAEEEDKAKQEADALRDAFSGYEEAVDKLDKCTRGTQEWRDALEEVNDAALKVLDNLPEDIDIGSAYNRNADGMIELNQSAIDAAQANLDKRASTASYASAMGNVRVQEAQVAVDAKELAKSLNSYQYHAVGESYEADQSVDTIRKIIEENAEELKGLTDEEFGPALEEMGVVMTNITDGELSNIKAGLSELGTAAEQAREKLELVAKLTVDEQLGDNYDGETKDAIAQRMADQENLRTEELINWMTGGSFNKADPLSDSASINKLVDMFSNAMGGGYSKAGNFVRGTDTNRSFAFLKDGEEVEYRAQEIAEIIAASEALGGLEENAQKVAETFAGLNDKIEADNEKSANAKAVKSFLANGNLNSLTDQELQDIMGLSDVDLKAMLMDTFGLKTEEEFEAFAQEWGFKTSEALINGFTEAGEESQKALDAIGKSLSSSTKRVFDNVSANKNLTIEAKQNLEGTLKQVFNNFGQEGLGEFEEILNGMGDDAGTFLENISNIDWESASPETLKNQLKELGINADDLSEDELKTLIKTLRQVGDASVDAAQQYNKNLGDAAKGVSGNNSIISDEDYQKLQDAGVNVRAFFQDMGDGTHQLTADADAFKQMVHDIQMGKLQEAQQNAVGKFGDLNEAKRWVNNVNEWEDGSTTQTGAMAYALKESGQVDNTTFEGWEDGGWVDNSEVAEKIRQAYADANMSAEKIDQMMVDAANEAERAQQAMDNAEFAFEVESAGLDLDETTRYAERLEKQMIETAKAEGASEEQLKLLSKAAKNAAINNQRLDRGIGNLKKNLKDYKKALTETNKGTAEWSEAMDSLKSDLADITGIDDADLLSDSFAENTLAGEDLSKALNGDIEAIRRLQTLAADDIMINVVANQSETETPEQIKGRWEKLKEDFAAIGDIDAPGVNHQQLLEDFNEMIKAGKMTKDQIEAALGGLHVSANLKTTYVRQKQQVPLTVTETTWLENGQINVPTFDPETGEQTGSYPKKSYKQITKTYDAGVDEADVVVPQYELEGTTDSATGNTVAFTDAPAPKPSTGGTSFSDNPSSGSSGGGGSKGSQTPVKKVKKTEKQDKERYTDNKNAIEDLSTSINRLSKSTDKAFGPQKIRNINLANSLLAQQAKRYQILYKEAKNYQKLDAADINTGLEQFNAKWGTQLKAVFDDEFLMDNEMEIRNAIADLTNQKIEEINRIENALNDLSNQGVMDDDPHVKQLKEDLEKIQEILDELNTDSENMVKKRIASYQEAIKEGQEAIDAIADLLREALENEIQKYTIARDLHLQINDLEQRHWRAIMDNMGEVGKLGKQTADMLSKSLESIGDSVDRYITHYNQMGDVQQRWANRDITLKVDFDISDEAWEQAMQDGKMPQSIMDAMQEDVDALMDLRQQVWDNLDEQWQNYIDSIQYYIDEYDRITDKLSSQMSISDHLLSVIETVGFNYKWGADEGSAQYKNMAAQLDAVAVKAKAVNGELAIATNRRKEAEKEMNKLLAGRDYKTFADTANEAEMFEFNRIKAHYDEMSDLETQLNEERLALLDEAYQKASEYAQQWGEVIRHEMDENLGAIFDSMDEAMDVYNQKRDIDTFYMDEVDKTFELNKLQREINEAINDISNPEALERYNKLLAEIEAKKEAGVQMTEKDLEILRAQFDLEQARDAYQDARNAKNTMRLTRDASGNYAYVYSADEAKIEDTQAKIEEAEHNLYKLHRDAADEYAETWLQLQVDWENFIDSIDQARYKQDAEYREMVDQRMAWYSQQSDMLANEIIKHNGAIDRSFADTTLGVITNTQDMTIANETYKQHHTELKDRLIENYQDWIDKADETMREVGDAMSDLEQVVNEETDKMMAEIDDLNATTEKLNEDSQRYLGDLGNFIADWVNEVNSMYDEVIRKIDEVIEAHKRMLEELARQADNAIAAGDNSNFDPHTDYNALAWQAYEKAGKPGNYKDWLANSSTGKWLIEQVKQASQDDSRKDTPWYGNINTDKDAIDHFMTGENYSGNGHNYHGNSQYDFNTNGDIIIKGTDIIVGNGPTATGGLIKTPQIRSLAEEGPELVLNESDTQNILNAVRAIRGVVQGQLGAAELGIIAKAGGIAGIAQSVNMQSTPQTVDQNVHIEASFPGVNAAAEVELALNNLIVQAAHYNLNNK